MKSIQLHDKSWTATLAHKKQSLFLYAQLLEQAEQNRIFAAAVIILLNVTVAAFSIPFLGHQSVSVLAYCLFMAPVFLTNALVLAQVSMKWTIPLFAVSIFVNVGVFIYGVTSLLNH